MLFGMQIEILSASSTSITKNNYLYNGKELHEEAKQHSTKIEKLVFIW